MVGCTVPFCNNSSKKGYIMKIFPRDSERRMQWVNNIKNEYKNWTPSKNSYLCEVHFAPEMWEQRIDNKRKLKLNAVPIIFGYFLKKKPFGNEELDVIKEKDRLIYDDYKEDQKKASFSNQELDVIKETDRLIYDDYEEDQIIISDKQVTSINETVELPLNTSTECISNTTKCTTECTSSTTKIDGKKEKDKNKKLEEINRKMQIHLTLLRKKNRILRSRIHRFQDKVNNDKYKKVLKQVFNEDQIKALFIKKRRIRNWCNETIQRALRLKFTCGVNGYEELLKQGMPFPSLRTLQRKL